MAGRAGLAAMVAVLLAAGLARAQDWQDIRLPATGPALSIGSPANGCVAGAMPLPPEGEGYQAIRLSRSRHWGHPQAIDYVQQLGRRAAAHGLGTIQIGDIGQARGGPMPWGHASHQSGRDIDVWFQLDVPALPREQREGLELASMVDGTTKRVDPLQWGDRQAELVRLAAADPRVDRIFVSPSIKLALCERADAERGWLRQVRPWFGHEAHFHVRLRCPTGSTGCVDQPPPPPGDGCGAELMSWFDPPPPAAAPKAPPPRPQPPEACMALLNSP